MVNIVVLQNTLNPISAAERVKINQNWDAIRLAFSSVQNQISFLSGGEEIDGIINRINTTLENANTEIQNAVNNLNSALDSKLTDVDNAVDSYNTMIQQAVDNLNQSLNAKISEVNLALVDLNNEISNSQSSTALAVQATENANQAVNSANDAISRINETINGFVNRGVWNNYTLYYTNNTVYYQGQTYIAKQNNTNKIPTNITYWTLFAERGEKGDKGDTGDAGAALSIQGSLTNVSQLPATGQAGQAYTVNGVLYVWSTNTSRWENVGNIKGEKGDRGERGERGEKGEPGADGTDADLTEITQTVTDLNREVTTHLNKKASLTEEGHVRLSSSITSTSETMAATPKAVKDVNDKIKIFNNPLSPTDYLTVDSTNIEAITSDSSAWLNLVRTTLSINLSASYFGAVVTTTRKANTQVQTVDVHLEEIVNSVPINHKVATLSRYYSNSRWSSFTIEFVVITGSGSPQGSVYGVKGMRYFDSDNRKTYLKTTDGFVPSNAGWTEIGGV